MNKLSNTTILTNKSRTITEDRSVVKSSSAGTEVIAPGITASVKAKVEITPAALRTDLFARSPRYAYQVVATDQDVDLVRVAPQAVRAVVPLGVAFDRFAVSDCHGDESHAERELRRHVYAALRAGLTKLTGVTVDDDRCDGPTRPTETSLLIEQGKQITDLRDKLAKLDGTLGELKAGLAAKDAVIAQKDRDLLSRDSTIAAIQENRLAVQGSLQGVDVMRDALNEYLDPKNQDANLEDVRPLVENLSKAIDDTLNLTKK